MNNVLPATVLLAAATLAWEVVVRVQRVPLHLVPPPAARDVLATLDACGLDEIVLLRLPAALKVSATLALLGAVIAEWVGGDRGLGRAILLANSNLDTPTTLAGVMTLAVIGVGLVGALALLERRLVLWQPAQ